jgi:hypothetical protein
LKVFLIIVLIYYYCLKDAQDIKDAFWFYWREPIL